MICLIRGMEKVSLFSFYNLSKIVVIFDQAFYTK